LPTFEAQLRALDGVREAKREVNGDKANGSGRLLRRYVISDGWQDARSRPTARIRLAVIEARRARRKEEEKSQRPLPLS
jgi:hypothetical protein